MKQNTAINSFETEPFDGVTSPNTSIIESRIKLLTDVKRIKHYFVNDLGIKEDHIEFLLMQSNNSIEKLRELYYEVIKFDIINGTQTASYVSENSMHNIANTNISQFANPKNVFHGVKYRASLTSVIKIAFEQSNKILENHGISIIDTSIFDIGCGAGKPLLIAIGDMGLPFKNAVGIDYFRKMINLANNNSSIMGLSDKIDFIFTDAVKFKNFYDTNIIYMYNPFDEDIMKYVEHNIRICGGRTILAYNKPVCAHLFSKENGWKFEFEQNIDDPDSALKIFSHGI